MGMRYGTVIAAVLLMAALLGLGWVHPAGKAGFIHAGAGRRVRILQFHASVGVVSPGQAAKLCYGVENARSVHISPLVPDVFPASNYCVEVVPEHTTHYTLLAEGFDGTVATRSVTLPVEGNLSPSTPVQFALSLR